MAKEPMTMENLTEEKFPRKKEECLIGKILNNYDGTLPVEKILEKIEEVKIRSRRIGCEDFFLKCESESHYDSGGLMLYGFLYEPTDEYLFRKQKYVDGEGKRRAASKAANDKRAEIEKAKRLATFERLKKEFGG
jgi:hypothetical protein